MYVYNESAQRWKSGCGWSDRCGQRSSQWSPHRYDRRRDWSSFQHTSRVFTLERRVPKHAYIDDMFQDISNKKIYIFRYMIKKSIDEKGLNYASINIPLNLTLKSSTTRLRPAPWSYWWKFFLFFFPLPFLYINFSCILLFDTSPKFIDIYSFEFSG